MPKKRRRKFASDSDTDFKESEDSEDESNVEDANEPIIPMELADPPANSSGAMVASEPHGVISAKTKPQGMYRHFKSKKPFASLYQKLSFHSSSCPSSHCTTSTRNSKRS